MTWAYLLVIMALVFVVIFMKIKLDAQEIVIDMLKTAYHDTSSLLEALTEARRVPVHGANKNPNKFKLDGA